MSISRPDVGELSDEDLLEGFAEAWSCDCYGHGSKASGLAELREELLRRMTRHLRSDVPLPILTTEQGANS